MCNESHFRVANYKDLLPTGQSFLMLFEKFPAPTAFFAESCTIPSHLTAYLRQNGTTTRAAKNTFCALSPCRQNLQRRACVQGRKSWSVFGLVVTAFFCHTFRVKPDYLTTTLNRRLIIILNTLIRKDLMPLRPDETDDDCAYLS